MPPLATTILLAGTLAAEPPPPDPAPPGGYWTLGEARERQTEPPDGEDELTIGSVLLSLGLLRAGAAGVTIYLARTSRLCPVVEEQCGGLEIYGYVGLGEGGLMIGTGIVYLAIGATRRRRHREWARGGAASRWLEPGRLELGPFLTPPRVGADPRGAPGPWPTGGGVQLQLRF